MLLESEPKPLGEDVSVKIPPVDNGKFVNKLNAKGGGDAAKAPAKSEPARVETPKPETPKAEPMKAEPVAPEATTSTAPAPATSSGTAAAPAPVDGATAPPKKSLVEAEQKVLSPSAKAPTAVTPPVPKAMPAPTPAAGVAQAPAPAAVEPPKAAPVKPEPAKAEPPKDAPKPATDAPGFSVQLAAFSDDKGANSLSNKLKKAGYAAYTEPLTTSSGTKLWRVRVGPFTTRDAAGAVRDKLKGDGYIGIVAPSK
jgi:DedD protein